MKILVVEDELRAAEYLRQGLTENGYAVDVAQTGADGLHAAMMGDHELVILDVMLPGVDGFADPGSARDHEPADQRDQTRPCAGRGDGGVAPGRRKRVRRSIELWHQHPTAPVDTGV